MATTHDFEVKVDPPEAEGKGGARRRDFIGIKPASSSMSESVSSRESKRTRESSTRPADSGDSIKQQESGKTIHDFRQFLGWRHDQ